METIRNKVIAALLAEDDYTAMADAAMSALTADAAQTGGEG